MIYSNEYTLTPGAAYDVVTLADVKEYCQIEVSDDDTLLAHMVAQAEEWVGKWCNVLLQPHTLVLKAKCFPSGYGRMEMPVSPVRSVTSVESLVDGVQTAFTDFELAGRKWRAQYLQRTSGTVTWPTVTYPELYPVTITLEVGYDDSADVPHAIKMAIKEYVKGVYDYNTPNLDKIKRWLVNSRVSQWSI